MNDDGHRHSWGPPVSGWPMFGPTGKIVREDDTPKRDDPEPCRSKFWSGKGCALFADGARPCADECRL